MLRNKNPRQRRKKSKFRILDFTLSFCILIFGFWILLYAQDEFIYDAKGKRDPFIALVTPDGRLLKLEREETPSGGLLLEGIIYDEHGLSYAIVNGEVVNIGDKVSDYQVLKIEKNKVKHGQTESGHGK